jgi:hypothetical protein
MTIPAQANQQTYLGDGFSALFGIAFSFDVPADIKVFITDPTTGVPASVTTGFSVSGGSGGPGTLLFVTPPASNSQITILDDPALTQPTDYTNLDAFPAESHERALDRVTRLCKRLHQQWLRTLRFPDGDPILDGTVSSTVNRRGKYLYFNLTTGALEYATSIIGQTLSQSVISGFLNPQTSAEIAAGATPVNFNYPAGALDRYVVNAIPGTTDMTAAFTAANNAWLNGGAPITLQSGSYNLASPLTITAPLVVNSGAALKVASTVTLNGPVVTPAGPAAIFTLPTTGVIAYIGAKTVGSGYGNGTYANVPLTGGTGTGAKATVVVGTFVSGQVASVTITDTGNGYTAGDSLSASNTNLGNSGSGFAVPVKSVAQVLGSLGGVDIYTRWFGDVPDGNVGTGAGTNNSVAFSQALGTAHLRGTSFTTAPNRLITLPGMYRCATSVFVGDNIVWQGAGKYATTLLAASAFTDPAGLVAIAGIGSYPTSFKGFAVLGQVGGAGGSGIVSTKNACFISDVWVGAFTAHPGIILGSSDNFLTDFAVELNNNGIQVTYTGVNISNGTTYQNSNAGILVSNSASTETGRTIISDVRSSTDFLNAVKISSGKHVTISNHNASGSVNSAYGSAAYEIDNSTGVIMEGCSGIVPAGASLAPGVLIDSTSTDVSVNGASMTGFYDGLQINGAQRVTVTGGRYRSNSRKGVYLNAGGAITVSGVQATGNTGAGIHSDNTAGSGYHQITGCGTFSNTAEGILANCGAASFTNLVGNMNRANGTNLSKTGTTANINDVGNF